jgi:hypothetical protein
MLIRVIRGLSFKYVWLAINNQQSTISKDPKNGRYFEQEVTEETKRQEVCMRMERPTRHTPKMRATLGVRSAKLSRALFSSFLLFSSSAVSRMMELDLRQGPARKRDFAEI